VAVLGRNSPMHSYNKATQFLRNARSTRFAPKGSRLNQSAGSPSSFSLRFASIVSCALEGAARRGGCGYMLVEHFAHLWRRTLRNERDKVIIKIGSAD
jgi:hypothetical protein